MPRDFKRESQWEKNAYKRYVFKCRLKDEQEKLSAVLGKMSYAEWVRQHLYEDFQKI